MFLVLNFEQWDIALLLYSQLAVTCKALSIEPAAIHAVINASGCHSQHYHLHFSEVIFKLISISDEKEELFEVYLEGCTKMVKTEIIKAPDLLQVYVNEIYHVLLAEVE